MRDSLVGWLLVGVVLVGGCQRSSTASVKVDGSSTVYPVTEAVAEEFRKERPEVRVTVGFSGTGGGFKKFAAGETDISDASRPIKPSEREACAANGVEFLEFEVAYDGLAVIVNPENDWCDCLTVEQLKAIWQPESTVETWSDVEPEWPEEPIALYGPGTHSGTFDYFTEAICGEEDASRADYMASEDDNMLVTGVVGDKYSLGYFGLAYYDANRERLKLLGVDSGNGQCIKPSPETVRNGTYKPLSRPLYIYVRKEALERPEVAEFVEFYLANVGKLAADVGYVAVPDDVAERNMGVLTEALTATVGRGSE